MGRIRTTKPSFYRHEGLQDLEIANPGAHCMLVFNGLFTLCDKAGHFEWKPRTIKLDILPFLPFDMETTLNLLAAADFVQRYEVDGVKYGCIPTFKKHQRITGKEAQAPACFPEPPSGNTGEAPAKHPGAQEGKEEIGREIGMEGNGERVPDVPQDDQPTKPTKAAAVCVALKSCGIGFVNPGNQILLQLLDADAEIGMFVAAAEAATKAGKGNFNYVLGTVKGQMEQARAMSDRAKHATAATGESAYQRRNRERYEEMTGTPPSRPAPAGEIIEMGAP